MVSARINQTYKPSASVILEDPVAAEQLTDGKLGNLEVEREMGGGGARGAGGRELEREREAGGERERKRGREGGREWGERESWEACWVFEGCSSTARRSTKPG